MYHTCTIHIIVLTVGLDLVFQLNFEAIQCFGDGAVQAAKVFLRPHDLFQNRENELEYQNKNVNILTCKCNSVNKLHSFCKFQRNDYFWYVNSFAR